ncbi:DUF5710 domain-containing protein [Methylovulum psychrotolerans]|uniref:DNA primase TraC n=1 Tax=Methylovulum psychrotolerans TaxID=1704499 RepID=A0A1Z4BVD3_9GAMM|nr:DUF5710 domain-containing protein [Methylovulum psychrotolerans]ASF45255.1 hypothetical protein CEK71_03795 [Methylovulum psychrotolerans]POZ53221.1 DNA primase TraC [Methylovulum psychrotolerans]
MASAKIYLTVPYAQKDAAKALGARWDAAVKKWYVPADKELVLFAQWQVDAGVPVAATPAKAKASGGTTRASTVTVAAAGDFVAYNGDAPPWE